MNAAPSPTQNIVLCAKSSYMFQLSIRNQNTNFWLPGFTELLTKSCECQPLQVKSLRHVSILQARRQL